MTGVARQVSPKMLIGVAVLFAVAVTLLRFGPQNTTDFGHFWLSARYWTHPYDESVAKGVFAAPYWWPEVREHDIFVFSYPPTLLLVMWPFGQLPMQMALLLFNGASAGVFMALCVRRVGWTALWALFSLPLFLSLILGQMGLPAACAVIAAFEVIETRPRLAGALLAVVACIKPQVVLAAPIVLWGRWDAVKAGLVTGVSALLASLVFGPHRWIEWVQHMAGLKAQMPYLPQVMPYLLFDGALWWRVVLIAVGLGFAAWERGLAGLLVGTFLISPYLWLYDVAGLSFLGLLILAEAKRLPPLMALGPFLLGLLLVVSPTYSETITLICLSLIALRVLAGRTPLGRAIEFVRPLTPPLIRFAPEGAAAE